MGRLNGTNEVPMADFDLMNTLGNVKFLMDQMAGLEVMPMTIVKIPSGGSIAWTIANGTDEPDVATSLTGLIVSNHASNAWWNKPYGEGEAIGVPPDCASNDGIWGQETDGSETMCRRCPRNRLGSGPDGYGKACKNMFRLVMLRESHVVPLDIVLAPMSLPNWASYLAMLAPMRLKPEDVITKIKLQATTNRKNQPYSRAQFQMLGAVDKSLVIDLKQSMQTLLKLGVETLDALTDGQHSA
ncbi:hypothetical protein FACS1894184_19240 [Clostridia bacterium]|nr:hypothetical protein FACS1894184_19240 [Clostridia bacterium]